MNLKLPINTPHVTHTPESSFLFSIIQEIPTSDEWICSRLLSMVVRKENIHEEFSMIGKYFEECPFFHIVNIKNEIVRDVFEIQFSECIQYAINGGYYVSAIVNTKHIQNYCRSIDFLHHIHIYGYDTAKQTVNIADHFRAGHFTFENCSFSEINLSRGNVDSDIVLVKLLKDIQFDLTPTMIISLIQEHLSGENLFIKYNIENELYPDDSPYNFSFGLKYYDCLIEIINGGRFPYKRPIVLICEHIKILKMLIDIISRKITSNTNYLTTVCNDLINYAELLKYHYIKVQIVNDYNESEYNEIKNPDQIKKIIELLLTVKSKEQHLLENILSTVNLSL